MKKTLVSALMIALSLSLTSPLTLLANTSTNYKVLNPTQRAYFSDKSITYNLHISADDLDFTGEFEYLGETIQIKTEDEKIDRYNYNGEDLFIANTEDLSNPDIPISYYIEKSNEEEYISITIGTLGSDEFNSIVIGEPLLTQDERLDFGIARSSSYQKESDIESSTSIEPRAEVFIKEDVSYGRNNDYLNNSTHRAELYLENDLYQNADGSAILRLNSYNRYIEDGLSLDYLDVLDVWVAKIESTFELLGRDASQITGYSPEEDPSESILIDFIVSALGDLEISGVSTSLLKQVISMFGQDISVYESRYGDLIEFTIYPDDDELIDYHATKGKGLPLKIRLDKDTNSTSDELVVDTRMKFAAVVFDGTSDYPITFFDKYSSVSADLATLR